jgi:hypothetical protein
MNGQIQLSSDVQTQLASILGPAPVSSWTRPLRSGQSFAEDSHFFPESQSLPQATHRAGCIRGILWAFGFQAAAVIVAIVVFKIFHAA